MSRAKKASSKIFSATHRVIGTEDTGGTLTVGPDSSGSIPNAIMIRHDKDGQFIKLHMKQDAARMVAITILECLSEMEK